MNSYNLIKRVSISLTALVLLSNISFGNSNDAWTEAKETKAAENGKLEEWYAEWDSIKDDWTQLSITPGKTDDELNFAWYSKSNGEAAKIKFGKNSSLNDAKELEVQSIPAVKGYVSNKATVNDLDENTTYYYSYTKNGKWTEPVMMKTQADNSFDFIFVGDPQIGSSQKNIGTGETKKLGQEFAVRNDSFNWNNTLSLAVKKAPNASFILSAGDQIQTRDKKKKDPLYTGNEVEYTGFLSADALRNFPIATSIGNHDSLSKNYSFHFNNPNSSELGMTTAGGDYYFKHGNALFIMLNTNNLNIAEHKAFIEEAIKNNSNSKWRIVTIHHDIYGSGEHSNEPQIVNLRYNLIPIFEKNKIDVVLTGHDHTYARSFLMQGGKVNSSTMISDDDYDEYFEGEKSVDNKYEDYLSSVGDENFIKSKNNVVKNPNGILYITANSASGSKYYELVDNQQSYVAKRWQRNIPSFSVMHIDENKFTINTYRTDTMVKIDTDFTIVK